MDELVKQIKTKRELVLSACDALKRAIENRSETNIGRQKTTITKNANEIHELKVKVQEMRIHKGDDKDEIKTWSESIEGDLETWDNKIAETQKTIRAWKEREQEDVKVREQELATKQRQDLFKESMEFDKAKMEQKM